MARIVDIDVDAKNHTHVKVGHTSDLCLAFIDELEKQLYINKTVEVGQ